MNPNNGPGRSGRLIQCAHASTTCLSNVKLVHHVPEVLAPQGRARLARGEGQGRQGMWWLSRVLGREASLRNGVVLCGRLRGRQDVILGGRAQLRGEKSVARDEGWGQGRALLMTLGRKEEFDGRAQVLFYHSNCKNPGMLIFASARHFTCSS